MDNLSEIRLPEVRKDLQFFEGPRDNKGEPTFTVFDPVSERYSKIGWAERAILRLLKRGMTVGQITSELRQKTTVRIEQNELLEFIKQAGQNNFLSDLSPGKCEQLEKVAASKKASAGQWLLSHYLFFKIPLLRPDNFLKNTVKYISLLGGPVARKIHLLVGLIGLALAITKSEQYFSTFADFLSLQGALSYAVALVFIKTVHEFSHAYTSRHFGAQVREMGIAFMVFCPIPFCNVTDAWKIPDRRKRLLIATAGILSELTIAGWSLLFWSLSSPGIMRGIFFVFSSLTIVTTLLVNLNPAMRFDGYYILSDLTGLDNLQSRAFALTKWHLRRLLLGINVTCPEENLTAGTHVWMIAYSIGTWIYRFFLYLGIAIFVYYKFTKALGTFLFVTEIWVFIIRPLVLEIRMLMLNRKLLRFNINSIITLLGVAAFCAWLIIPFKENILSPAIALPRYAEAIYVSGNGKVVVFNGHEGAEIKRGQLLLELDSPLLKTKLKTIIIEKKIIAHQLDSLKADNEKREFEQQKRQELEEVEARIAAVNEELKKCKTFAPHDGTLYNWNTNISVGQSINEGEILGYSGDFSSVKVIAYVSGKHLKDINIGDSVSVVTSASPEKMTGKIIRINQIQEEDIKHPSLTTVGGGDIPVVPKDKKLIPTEGFYEIEVEISDGKIFPGQTGTVIAKGKSRSVLSKMVNKIMNVSLKESGF